MIAAGMPFIITGTSPAAAGTALVGAALGGLGKFDLFKIDAVITQATGGVLDLCLQRLVSATAPGVWADWLHFTQLAAGSTVFKYSVNEAYSATDIFTVGTMPTTLAGNEAITLAAGKFVGGHPGDALRLVAVAGSSTSAGATQTIYITPIKTYT